MASYESPRCPLCRQPPDTPYAVSYSAAEAAQHFVLAEEYPQRHAELRDHITGLWSRKDCHMSACRQCALTYAWPFVAGDGHFYNLAYPYSAYPAQRWQFLRTLDSLRSASLDPWCGQLAAVFLFQVLEHMDDLHALTARLTELTRPRAALFVAVPNHDRTTFNEAHASLCDMPPNHISQWTPQALQRLADTAGWRLDRCEREPFSWPAFMRGQLVYAHMRRARKTGALSNKVRSRPRSGARQVAEAAMALAAMPAHSVLAGRRRRGAFARQFALGSLPALMRQSLCLGGASLVWAMGVVVS